MDENVERLPRNRKAILSNNFEKPLMNRPERDAARVNPA